VTEESSEEGQQENAEANGDAPNAVESPSESSEASDVKTLESPDDSTAVSADPAQEGADDASEAGESSPVEPTAAAQEPVSEESSHSPSAPPEAASSVVSPSSPPGPRPAPTGPPRATTRSSRPPPSASPSNPPSAPPPGDPDLGSVAEPIRAMRVIKLEQSSSSKAPLPPRAPVASAPAIETGESSFEELEGELDEEELKALEGTPVPSSTSDLPRVSSSAPTSGPNATLTEAATAAASADNIPPQAPIPAEALEEPVPESVEPEAETFDEIEPVEELPEEGPTVRRKFVPEPPPAPEVPAADRKPPPPRRSAKPSLPQAKRPRKKPWWETLFGDDFSRAYRPMNERQLAKEVDFIVESLALPKGAVILDLGCGQGEICVELSRRGYSVVGYDLSVYQLAMAGDCAQAARQKINFLQGDMREMAFEQMFDAVLCWDTTFGYFEEEKNVDVLERIKRALKPGGRFLLDVMNRDFAAREAPYNHWFEGDGCVCMDDMVMDWITNRLKVKRSIILDDGRSKELQYSVRLYGLSDVGRMLHDVGFRVSKVSGDVSTQGAFFGPNSRRIIIQSSL